MSATLAAARTWSPANSGACDDENPCTKDDRCQDGTCKGEYYGDQCADKLSCTEDVCDGRAAARPSTSCAPTACLIDGVCYNDQQQDTGGCNLCDAKTSQSAWTPLAVSARLAASATRPARRTARDAPCATRPRTPAPGPSTAATASSERPATSRATRTAPAVSICDPTKTKTDWTPVADTCKIGNSCFKAGDPDPTACGTCDPAASTTAWTIKGANCLVGTACYTQGQTNPTGCGVCEPAQSKTSWSPPASQCLIGTTCVANAAKDSTGCRACDVSATASGWTPLAGVSSSSFDFEDGKTPPTGWTIANTHISIGWVVANRRPGQGSYSLYYGDPSTGTIDSGLGTTNSGTADMPSVTLTAGKKAGLSFLLYLDIGALMPFPAAPVFEVQVNGTVLWTPPVGLPPARVARGQPGSEQLCWSERHGPLPGRHQDRDDALRRGRVPRRRHHLSQLLIASAHQARAQGA